MHQRRLRLRIPRPRRRAARPSVMRHRRGFAPGGRARAWSPKAVAAKTERDLSAHRAQRADAPAQRRCAAAMHQRVTRAMKRAPPPRGTRAAREAAAARPWPATPASACQPDTAQPRCARDTSATRRDVVKRDAPGGRAAGSSRASPLLLRLAKDRLGLWARTAWSAGARCSLACSRSGRRGRWCRAAAPLRASGQATTAATRFWFHPQGRAAQSPEAAP